ncbi:MAG: alpha/beta hydrolase, partial [Bacteroidales bacterium]|nr:alpha/beta hydrolase [Bacteroidales bacterium]
VIAEPNKKAIVKLAGKNVHYKVLENLNHLFQHCTTGSPDEYMLIEETFAPEAMKIIADWILNK